MRKDINEWDLKEIIEEIVDNFNIIEEIHLFGSRAYKTGSLRSDIDLIAYSKSPLPLNEIIDFIRYQFKPVDLFETIDKKIARSIVNGSIITSETDVINKVDSILLWSKSGGFDNNYVDWIQKTLADYDFKMSMISNDSDIDIEETYIRFMQLNEYPYVYLGDKWRKIGDSIVSLIESSMMSTQIYNKRATNICVSNMILKNEYDFQNYIATVLKPWIPSLEPETVVIKYDGQDKKCDFSISSNSIIIETKHIKDKNTKATVLKTLSGLGDFYKTHPNIKELIILLLVDEDVDLDVTKIEMDYSYKYNTPMVITKIIRNKLGK